MMYSSLYLRDAAVGEELDSGYAVSFGARPAMPGASIGPGLTTLTGILRSFKSNGRAACDKRDLSFKFS